MTACIHDVDPRFMGELRRAAPAEFETFKQFNTTALDGSSGQLGTKVRELIAIGVALTTQCPHCIQHHVTSARTAGASLEEIGETVFVAAALRAGGAISHGRLAMKSALAADTRSEAGAASQGDRSSR